jgi:hypothetical protein
MAKCASTPPVIPEYRDLVHFNVMFAHLFSCLSHGQAMFAAVDINQSKLLTVTTLMDSNFLAIQGTDDKRTPNITLRTVGYIHALMIDSVTLLQSASPNACALQNEKMIVEELSSVDPDTWRRELLDYLVDYYEGGVLMMAGAGGLPLATTFKRKFKGISNEDDPAEGAQPTDADNTPAPDDGAGAGAAAGAAADAGAVADAGAAANAVANEAPLPPPHRPPRRPPRQPPRRQARGERASE